MTADFLKKVPLFADLPEADLERLGRLVQEVRLDAGQELFADGSPGDRAYVVMVGQLEVVKPSGGREVLLAVRGPGEVVGEMALLEEAPRMATVRARAKSVLLAVGKEQFEQLMHTSPSAARAMFYNVLARWRATEAALHQSEKMAQLGTLTAGVAHELNNPASAVKRGAEQLQGAITALAQAQARLGLLSLSPRQGDLLQRLAERAQQQGIGVAVLEPLARSDREQELQAWLEGVGATDAWEIAPILVDLNYPRAELETLGQQFTPNQLSAVLSWLAAISMVYRLLAEIGHGAGRISEIVKALKSYSYLDQAPVQAVDVHEGLENTLVILRHKLKGNIAVRREYAPDLPKIEGYGSELNQVWTNLLDNAADALEGRSGTITLRTRREQKGAVVEIEDDGPGIPQEAQPRIFDPFFTTKPMGKGTGLGLHITYNIIVQKHGGEIQFTSRPGSTRFRVWLPLRLGPGG